MINPRTTSPDGSKSPCLECIRAGEECILAGSRRGGDFSKFRRQKQKQTLSISTPDKADQIDFQENSECKKGVEDPIYAELTNPGDALQILARLAADDPKQTHEDADSRKQISPGSDFCKDEVNSQTAISDTGSIKRIQTPTFQRPLSETETLVIGILGTETARGLLHQYENRSPAYMNLG